MWICSVFINKQKKKINEYLSLFFLCIMTMLKLFPGKGRKWRKLLFMIGKKWFKFWRKNGRKVILMGSFLFSIGHLFMTSFYPETWGVEERGFHKLTVLLKISLNPFRIFKIQFSKKIFCSFTPNSPHKLPHPHIYCWNIHSQKNQVY